VNFIEIFSQQNFQHVEKESFYDQLEKQHFWLSSPLRELTLLLYQFEKLIEKNSLNEQKWLMLSEKYFSDKKNKLTILEKISEISLILTHFEKISPTFYDLVLEIISVKFPKNDFKNCLLIFLDILAIDNYLSKNYLLGTFFDTSENIDVQFLNKILHGN
jgi:hypothetical protein